MILEEREQTEITVLQEKKKKKTGLNELCKEVHTPLNPMRHSHSGVGCTLYTDTHPLWFSFPAAVWVVFFPKLA